MNIPVSQVVGSFIDENNLGKAEYAKAYRIAIRGCRELSFDITGQVVTSVVVSASDGTIIYPEDCVKILDFGISDGDGGIASYDKVDNLTDNNLVSTYNDGYNDSEYLFSSNSTTLEASLGIGSYNSIGEYRLDDKQRKIYLRANKGVGTYIVKHTSYKEEDCEYEVNIMASEALLAFITWRYNMTGSKTNQSIKDANMREYHRLKTNAKLKIKMPTKQQLSKNSRETTRMSIKS